jgi:hypothetical protein
MTKCGAQITGFGPCTKPAGHEIEDVKGGAEVTHSSGHPPDWEMWTDPRHTAEIRAQQQLFHDRRG